MSMKKLIQASLIVAAFALTVTLSRGAVLINDNFNSGVLDTSVWVFNGASQATTTLELIGPSDYAAACASPTAGGAGVWSPHITTATSYARGNNLCLTFKWWFDAPPGVYEAQWGTALGTFGLSEVQATADPNSSNMSGIDVLYWNGDAADNHNFIPAFGSGRFAGNWGALPSNNLPILGGVIRDDLLHAQTSNTAVTVRVWMGPTSGCRVEYKPAGASSWTCIGDNRNVWGGTAANVWVGLFALYGKQYMDDVTLENGGTAPALPNQNFMGALYYENCGTLNGPVQFAPSAQLSPIGHYDRNSNATVADAGGGDLCLKNENLGQYWGSWFSGEANAPTGGSFARGNNLRVSCMAWRGAVDSTVTTALNFGFHKAYWEQTHQTSSAMIGHPANENGGMGLVESAWPGSYPTLEGTSNNGVLWTDAWRRARNKDHAVHFRITLGNTTGAMLEWSLDGITWTSGGDDRETGGDAAASGLIIRWSTGMAATFVDEIVVENSVNQFAFVPVELSSFGVE